MILVEDAFDLLERLTSKVDLLLTDPPYGTTQLPWDQEPDWKAFLTLARQALSPQGNLVLFASGKAVFRVARALEDLGWPFYELVWPKRRATGFYDASRRPLRAHEWILVAPARWGSSTYNPQKWQAETLRGRVNRGRSAGDHWGQTEPVPYEDDGTRYPLSVLPPFPLTEGEDRGHPTQKPLALARYLVLTYSDPGDLVADPYAGSGTFGVAALSLGRRFLGAEADPRWREVAEKRLEAVQPVLMEEGATWE